MKKTVLILLLVASCLNVIYAVSPTWATKAIEVINVTRASGTVVKSVQRLGRFAGALPESEIVKLANICKNERGLEEVGQILGKGKYADNILEDAYLRIALTNEKIPPAVASEAFEKLSGTPGFRTVLRKINSASASQAKGHMQELMIALESEKRGLKVAALGLKYSDGIKQAETDVDVILTTLNKSYAIESKAYAGDVPLDMVRADAKSLEIFCSNVKYTVPVFCFQNKPSVAVEKILQKYEIKSLYGTSEEICAQLDVMSRL